ncbi:hypothetical protein N781_15705 [Pontibacillus halophilus JSM 076056 = DSM 19796]|uniref:Uncharacterized protein n=1 Tax=Pontibacillus halophilus JSM 076056 = DSM 19796 TaxID=1385510 RepID=A0A0A5GNH8_9BACI|nr:DUF5082 family protein [Pontibacillus halophilus]KGX92808.1 hypothetical protein N781_15705 [Pontibacillus halophilus JSM 076056 = DSM 19796]
MADLSYLYNRLEEKQEQLERLHQAGRELNDVQDEFYDKRHLVKEPELTPTTWKGNLANEFDEIRERMDVAYTDVSSNQMGDAYAAITSKMDEIRSQIGILHDRISAERERLREERMNDNG